MEILFSAGPLRATVLTQADVAELQAFFEANPEYTLTVSGELPRPTEAQEEFDDVPPADMPYTGRWHIGFRDDTGALVGFAGLLSDLIAERVWHIGIFIVATALHGSGVARHAYEHLEAWVASKGAQWLRLGVVEGNTRAERFWRSRGYRELRRRGGYVMGQRSNVVLVFFKPLAGGSVDAYLAMVARDRPESP